MYSIPKVFIYRKCIILKKPDRLTKSWLRSSLCF